MKKITKILPIIIAVLIIGTIFYVFQNNWQILDKFKKSGDSAQKNTDYLINQINSEQTATGTLILGQTDEQKETGQKNIDNEKDKNSEIIQQEMAPEDFVPNRKAKIKIIKKPSGEEPDWVNEAWIGLEIPVIEETYAQKGGFEVLSGNFREQDNYVVPLKQALEILKQKKPDAEKWWRENVNLTEIYGIGFERSVCELIEE